jgi:2-polyprenyl-3-methyl-5-hydroxy-6-metoxy-1,4-benzoquinol methylase
MNCCQIQGLEKVFDQPMVTKELARYRRNGPVKTTRLLIEAIEAEAVSGMTLLDIGGGVGAVQHALLRDGLQHATDVDASPAYLAATRSEAQRLGFEEQITYHFGNFVDLASEIPPADLVTLDRVICCYPDMEQLVSLSAAKAKKRYGLVYPRHTWWMKLFLRIGNFYFRLRKNPYRMFLHPSESVEAILQSHGFTRRYYTQTMIWQVVVYSLNP